MHPRLYTDTHPEAEEVLISLLRSAPPTRKLQMTDAIIEAVEQRSAFNVIHLATAFKVDIFVRKERAFERGQFARRVRLTLPDEPERTIHVAGAEDLILAKLEWYRLGGETSERQWMDIVEILRVQAGELQAPLDIPYMQRAAVELGVVELLEKLLS